MKKKFTALTMALLMFVLGGFSITTDVYAEEIGEDVDYSLLLTDDALIGYATMQTRGVYLAQGTSIINDAGSGKIGAGGVTNAAVKCTVSVNAVVERKTSTGWARVTSWTVTNTNALTAIASKYISVGSGYWYRVRCNHHASSDTSSSCTDALWM